MKPSVFHPEALAELLEQAVFYDERSPGLGARITTQVEAPVTPAASMPGVGAPCLCGTRRVFPRDFPHSIIYLETVGALVILAIAPFRRKPGYWRQRR